MTDPSLSLLVLRSPRLDVVRQFYESLGLRLSEERHGSGPLHYSCSLGETVLEFYPADGPEAPTEIRLGLALPDLSSALERIRRIGGDILKSGATSAVVRDPDGRKVELTQRTR